MSGKQAADPKSDPFEEWRSIRDAYMEAWSNALNAAVKSGNFPQGAGGILEIFLTACSPLREAIQKVMLATLEQLMLPSREDLVTVTNRLTSLETRLDDIGATLNRIETLLDRSIAPSSKPTRKKIKSPTPAQSGNATSTKDAPNRVVQSGNTDGRRARRAHA